MSARRSKASVALVPRGHVPPRALPPYTRTFVGLPLIELPTLRDAVACDAIPVEILQRSRCYVHSRELADKWIESVIWLRTQSRDGWILDKEVKRKATT